MILTRGKSLEVPLGELHRVGVPASVSAAKDSGQPDIARIVKETLQALNGNKSARIIAVENSVKRSCARLPRSRAALAVLMARRSHGHQSHYSPISNEEVRHRGTLR